jgi:hypothetical protein
MSSIVGRFLAIGKRRDVVYGTLVILVATSVSVALSMQGWRSRVPAFDLLTYHYGIRDFLETGIQLQHGDTGSYGSYKPPGTAWLMLPGVLVLDDPRLTDYVGTVLLHLSTLVGLFLLARRLFGLGAAALTVVLYALSQHGLFLAGSLWPNGRPDFYVWVVYFAVLWATRQDGRFLALSLTILGLGMYVDLALLPVLFVFPVLWIIYRPSIRPAPLLASAAVLVLVWMPYLRFEMARGFVDIRSQVFQRHVPISSPRDAWCDPNATLLTLAAPADSEQAGQTAGLVDKVFANFDTSLPLPRASVILLLMILGGMLLACVAGWQRDADDRTGETRASPRGVLLAGGGLVATGVAIAALRLIADIVGIDRLTGGSGAALLGRLLALSVASGLAVLGAYGLAVATDRALVRRRIHIQTPARAGDARAVVLGLFVPWFLLLLFAEPGKPERFMWLWSLQSLFLAAFVTYLLPRLHGSRWITRASQAIVIVIIASNYMLIERVESWWDTGWAGRDAVEVQVVDAVSGELAVAGRDAAAIGYEMFIYPFMAEYHVTNPVYKVGAELDLLFRLRGGITNTNQCAEGISSEDEYRIVETEPKPPSWAPREYFAVDRSESFELVDQFGTHQVHRRLPASGEVTG